MAKLSSVVCARPKLSVSLPSTAAGGTRSPPQRCNGWHLPNECPPPEASRVVILKESGHSARPMVDVYRILHIELLSSDQNDSTKRANEADSLALDSLWKCAAPKWFVIIWRFASFAPLDFLNKACSSVAIASCCSMATTYNVPLDLQNKTWCDIYDGTKFLSPLVSLNKICCGKAAPHPLHHWIF